MKKLFVRACACALGLSLLSASALAKEELTGRPIADGTVTAVTFTDVTAPFSGTLSSFDLSAGQAVEAGETLMRFVATDLYATEDGTVAAVFGSAGDDAEAVTRRYGGVVGVEPVQGLLLNATTLGAYNDDDNKLLHLGEMVYFKSAKADKEEGSGRVIAVSASSYQVEILTGSFGLGESMSLYRNDKYDAKKCVGKGVVARRDDVLTAAQGRVSEVYVTAGEAVKAGQRLFSVLSADAAPDASADVTAPEAAVIAAVSVQPGQQVWRGEVLLRLYNPAALEVVADVDEMDLGNVRVGDTLPVTLDVSRDNIIIGTVTEISALGVTKLNAAYYTVHVSIPAGSGKLGASASVYLPEKD